ncbi:MAG: O-antigen ligase family protein [Gemmatimonadetes bacterium]|nr:O-antigen ligase family protein [Gemmatimonadota bacterium]NNF13751.1 O-antigen ligase family protein [Gemmatimonadota bacterium]
MSVLLLAPASLAGLGVAIAIFHRPAIGAALILAVVNFEGSVEVAGVSAVKLLSALCGGILLLRVVVAKSKIKVDLTTWFIALFLTWVAITVFWNPDTTGFSSDLISLCLQAMMYVLIINLVRSKEDLKLALWGYVIGGTVLAIILGETMVVGNFRRSTDMEVAGLGLNLAARMVGLNLLLALTLLHLHRRSLPRLVLIGAAVVSGVSSVLALSRGNWYALTVSFGALVFVLSFKKGLVSSMKQGLLVAAVASIAMFSAGTFLLSDYGLAKLEERFESAYTFSDRASGRFDIWETVLVPFLEKPFVGHGFNSFRRVNEWGHEGAHNSFVLIAVEDGLIGVVLFLLVLGSVVYPLWITLRNDDSNAVTLGWGVALFVFLATVSVVDSSVNRKYLWFVLGLISLLVHFYGKQPTPEVAETAPSGADRPGGDRVYAGGGAMLPSR